MQRKPLATRLFRLVPIFFSIPAAFLAPACMGDDPAAVVSNGGGGVDAGPATPATDAQTPSSADADAASRYCDAFRTATFCEDFDTITDTSSLTLEVAPETTARLTGATSKSPPRALFFQPPNGKVGFATLTRSFPTERPLRLSFDWWLGANQVRPAQIVQFMTLRRKNDQVSLQRNCNEAGTACDWSFILGMLGSDASNRFTVYPLGNTIPPEAGWTRTTIEARFSKASGYIKLLFDGKSSVEATLPTTEEVLPETEATGVSVGFGALQGVFGDTSMAIDNVVVEIL